MAELLRTSQAAERLGVSGETLRRWVERNQIEHVRLPSGHLRFRPEDLDAWLTPVKPEMDGAA